MNIMERITMIKNIIAIAIVILVLHSNAVGHAQDVAVSVSSDTNVTQQNAG